MRKGLIAIGVLAMLAGTSAIAQTAAMTNADASDPYIWLEDKDGAKALQWVEAENAKTLPQVRRAIRALSATYLSGRVRRSPLRQKIAFLCPTIAGLDVSYNFWRDKAIIRMASGAGQRRGSLRTRPIAKLDDRSSTSTRWARPRASNWVWKGAVCLEPRGKRLCMVALSGGRRRRGDLSRIRSRQGRFRRGRIRAADIEAGRRRGSTRTR